MDESMEVSFGIKKRKQRRKTFVPVKQYSMKGCRVYQKSTTGARTRSGKKYRTQKNNFTPLMTTRSGKTFYYRKRSNRKSKNRFGVPETSFGCPCSRFGTPLSKTYEFSSQLTNTKQPQSSPYIQNLKFGHRPWNYAAQAAEFNQSSYGSSTVNDSFHFGVTNTAQFSSSTMDSITPFRSAKFGGRSGRNTGAIRNPFSVAQAIGQEISNNFSQMGHL